MAGKAKFDQEAAFKSIIGAGREPEMETVELQPASKGKKKERVQRSYFLDRDIDKALKKKALEDEKNLTDTINDALRQGLKDYLYVAAKSSPQTAGAEAPTGADRLQ